MKLLSLSVQESGPDAMLLAIEQDAEVMIQQTLRDELKQLGGAVTVKRDGHGRGHGAVLIDRLLPMPGAKGILEFCILFQTRGHHLLQGDQGVLMQATKRKHRRQV